MVRLYHLYCAAVSSDLAERLCNDPLYCVTACFDSWVPLQALQERTPSVSVGAPAYQQALYMEKVAHEAASRHRSIELAARALSYQPAQQGWQSSLTDEQLQGQQTKCTVIKGLLQLSPLLAEESVSHQTSAEALLHELLNSRSPMRVTEDMNDTQAELRQLCISSLASLATQPQSISSLLVLPGSKDCASRAEMQSQCANGHVLLTRVSELMQVSLQVPKVTYAIRCLSLHLHVS